MATDVGAGLGTDAVGAPLERVWLRVVPVLRALRRKPLGTLGLVILLVLSGAALLAPIVAPYHYAEVDFGARLAAPNGSHWLGTDHLGRDVFSRIVYAARVSFGISFAAVVIAKTIATVLAVMSGYYGGVADKFGQRLIDIWLALPTLIILVTLLGVLGAGPLSLIVVIGLSNAPGSQRLIRSIVVSVREEAYVEAAVSLGASDARVMLQHILPNITHLVIYSATVTLGSVMLIVASLGFLGYGVPPPTPDLGAMLSGDGLTFMRRQVWMAIGPGLTITLVVFAFNVWGDAMRDILDPRLRGS
jgi:peptide/nickel transport system permease protein